MYRSGIHRGAVLCTLAGLALVGSAALGGCGGTSESEGPLAKAALLPGPRFAGVDLVYALRRVAARSGRLLALDEINMGPGTPDLDRFRIDLDLEASSLEGLLDQLKAHTQAFDFLIHGKVIYVRSLLSLDQATALERADLPAATLDTDIEGVVRWIMTQRPASFLKVRRIRGEPIFRKVSLTIEADSSPRDVLLAYAEAAQRGWRMRRSGERFTDPQGRAAIVANTLALWGPLDEPNMLPRIRKKDTTLAVLANVAKRTSTPICIIDRSMLGGFRSWLDFRIRRDPGTPALEAVAALAWGGRDDVQDDFSWVEQDGVIRIATQMYQRIPAGQDLLADTVRAGRFHGSLPELARWLNQNRSTPAEKLLMGGEIAESWPQAELEIAAGASVESVLLDFARATGVGWNLVVADLPKRPGSETATKAETLPSQWRGAYIRPLDLWVP